MSGRADIVMVVLRVYLDQNHWVSLMKAETERPDGRRFRDVALLLSEAVNRGFVSLPLSMTHAMELQNRANFQSRVRLASTMIRLSRWHAIAPQRVLLAAELDQALRSRFGRPTVPRSGQVFGVGANHLYGRTVVKYEPPEEFALTPEQRRVVTTLAQDFLQVASLVGGPRDLELPDYDPTAHQEVGRRFASQQEEMRETRRQHGYHRGEKAGRAASVDVFDEFNVRLPMRSSKLACIGVTSTRWSSPVWKLSSRTSRPFTPTERYVGSAKSRPKSRGKRCVMDLMALPPAIVYCDVVVTERLWTDLARRTDLGSRFGTTVIRSLHELVPFLIEAAAAKSGSACRSQ